MILVTETLRQRLLANGATPDGDPAPVVRLFDPCGAGTWLLTEMLPDDPDILFGLCDLGLGFPELGSVSLAELESVKGPLGLGIERDIYFAGLYPLSVYADAAVTHGAITTNSVLLDEAAIRLAWRKDGGPL